MRLPNKGTIQFLNQLHVSQRSCCTRVVRGSKSAYDEWGAKAPGWSYHDLAPHWQTVLDNFDFTTNDGSMARPQRNGEYINSLVGMCEEAGYTLNEEFNTIEGPHNGCNYRHHQGPISYANGEPFVLRQTAYTQFIQPFLQDRPNLHVMTNRRVMKVDTKDSIAKGVLSKTHGPQVHFTTLRQRK